MPALPLRTLAVPASLAFASGVATGLLVAAARLRRRARATLPMLPFWSADESDLTRDLLHLPVGAR